MSSSANRRPGNPRVDRPHAEPPFRMRVPELAEPVQTGISPETSVERRLRSLAGSVKKEDPAPTTVEAPPKGYGIAHSPRISDQSDPTQSAKPANRLQRALTWGTLALIVASAAGLITAQFEEQPVVEEAGHSAPASSATEPDVKNHSPPIVLPAGGDVPKLPDEGPVIQPAIEEGPELGSPIQPAAYHRSAKAKRAARTVWLDGVIEDDSETQRAPTP